MVKKRIPKKKLLNLVRKYKKKLKLDNYEIDIIFSDSPRHIVTNKIVADNSARADVVRSDSDENEFTIVFYDFSNIESDVIHELLHIRFWDVCKKYKYKKLNNLEHDFIEALIPIWCNVC
jgi:hypothetical protein